MIQKEINPIEALKAIRIFLRKYATHKNIEEPNVTLFWFHKHEDMPVVIENGAISHIQRKACERTLLKMLKTNLWISYDLQDLGDEKVAAISNKLIIFVLAGIEQNAAIAILAKALLYAQAISSDDYSVIKHKAPQQEFFAVVER